ncbi:calbindin 2a isoform X2 [Hypanus sabinus]|uniref:calbindin 2a isoform X2 n=1 Tax=Hypanus sabinus TaxID=79690 RepID=UPI0028C37A35|nr:calbindin 2a isoform X2 [Hypanus sabinus]
MRDSAPHHQVHLCRLMLFLCLMREATHWTEASFTVLSEFGTAFQMLWLEHLRRWGPSVQESSEQTPILSGREVTSFFINYHEGDRTAMLGYGQSFLRDLLKKANRHYDDKKLQEYTQTILKMFDANGDGKLGLSEMARLLPVQENFLLRFQDDRGSKVSFSAKVILISLTTFHINN